MLIETTFCYLPHAQRYQCEGDILFSVVFICGCVGVHASVYFFVNAITLEPFELSSRNFYGNKIWSKARMIRKWLHSDAVLRAGVVV